MNNIKEAELYYERDPSKPFTLTCIYDQVVEFIKEHNRFPEVIYLPAEERVYISYLTHKPFKRVNNVLGIEIKHNFDLQKIPFNGI